MNVEFPLTKASYCVRLIISTLFSLSLFEPQKIKTTTLQSKATRKYSNDVSLDLLDPLHVSVLQNPSHFELPNYTHIPLRALCGLRVFVMAKGICRAKGTSF